MSEGEDSESLSLRFLLDENFERAVAERLRDAGHDAELSIDIPELGQGAHDAEDIAPYARRTDRIILTKDTDFLSMDENQHAGVLFLNDHRVSAVEIGDAVLSIVDAYPSRGYFQGKELVDRWL